MNTDTFQHTISLSHRELLAVQAVLTQAMSEDEAGSHPEYRERRNVHGRFLDAIGTVERAREKRENATAKRNLRDLNDFAAKIRLTVKPADIGGFNVLYNRANGGQPIAHSRDAVGVLDVFDAYEGSHPDYQYALSAFIIATIDLHLAQTAMSYRPSTREIAPQGWETAEGGTVQENDDDSDDPTSVFNTPSAETIALHNALTGRKA